jgi:folate-dependent phosphoribosylglycinamide formyltransferase PurN
MEKTIIDLFREYGISIDKQIPAAVIASGSGTTAMVYMLGAKTGAIPGVDMRLLISTKPDAGCIEKARQCGVPDVVIDRKKYGSLAEFNVAIRQELQKRGIELVYLAGCNYEIEEIPRIYIPNNHPAPKETDGGKGMHQAYAHEHVLTRIQDEIKRYPHKSTNVWRTSVDHHEAISRNPNEKGMDVGDLLTRTCVDIPPYIINRLMDGAYTLYQAAEELQKHVMRYEYMSIISSAMIDAQRVRDAKRYGIKIGGFWEKIEP